MEYLENNKIKDFVKDAIIDKLDLHKDNQYYACDLAYELFEEENVNGAYFCNNYTAKEWLNKNFDDLGEIVEEISSNFDGEFVKKIIVDIFDNPDCFIVVIVLEVANYILSQCKTIEKNWDNEIILNDEIIKKIEEELKIHL